MEAGWFKLGSFFCLIGGDRLVFLLGLGEWNIATGLGPSLVIEAGIT